MLKPFTVVPAQAEETPVIVEVPHAGLHLDAESIAVCTAPGRSIGQDADLYVSELFARSPELGASYIYSNLSRYVCDLNRAESDLDSHTCSTGTALSSPHGVVWRKTTEGRPAISSPLSEVEIERRLELIYRPYHAALYNLVQAKKERFGYAIVLCGHSMPSFGRLGERRADVVPGSRGKTTCARPLLKLTEACAAKSDYDVAHDAPYRGGFTTGHYGSPASYVHALQIELARHIYMDEASLSRSGEKFRHCENFCLNLVRALGALKLPRQK